jgi:hypothetical protein
MKDLEIRLLVNKYWGSYYYLIDFYFYYLKWFCE